MRTPRASPCWNRGPAAPGMPCVPVLLAGWNSLMQIQCAYWCGEIGAEDGFLSWGPEER